MSGWQQREMECWTQTQITEQSQIWFLFREQTEDVVFFSCPYVVRQSLDLIFGARCNVTYRQSSFSNHRSFYSAEEPHLTQGGRQVARIVILVFVTTATGAKCSLAITHGVCDPRVSAPEGVSKLQKSETGAALSDVGLWCWAALRV